MSPARAVVVVDACPKRPSTNSASKEVFKGACCPNTVLQELDCTDVLYCVARARFHRGIVLQELDQTDVLCRKSSITDGLCRKSSIARIDCVARAEMEREALQTICRTIWMFCSA